MAKKIKIVERKLGREKALGQYWQGEGLIEIDPRQAPKEILSVIVHELLHVAMENATEDEVLRIEKIMAEALWNAGYRKVEQ